MNQQQPHFPSFRGPHQLRPRLHSVLMHGIAGTRNHGGLDTTKVTTLGILKSTRDLTARKQLGRLP